MATKTVHPDVLCQLEALSLDSALPLIITDADEVLIEFMVALEAYLEECGMYFDWTAFSLSGTIRRRADRSVVGQEQVEGHLENFFASRTEELTPVPGAAEALAGLSRRAQIVVLTNLPLQHREVRQRSLARHGMNYPVIANVGAKGWAVRRLAEQVKAPVFFLDDIPRNHTSVATAAEWVYRVHLVADPRLGNLLGPAKDSHCRAADWAQARAVIERRLDEQGY